MMRSGSSITAQAIAPEQSFRFALGLMVRQTILLRSGVARSQRYARHISDFNSDSMLDRMSTNPLFSKP
ncbi:MAG: hypothetical protein F6K16_32920 [Symploca sp. SIO2B6]|nr:hypothetical protein [Symploca sp. SIO2B6]